MAARKQPAPPLRHSVGVPAPQPAIHPQANHAPVNAPPAPDSPRTMQRLQRVLGNRAVGRLLRTPAPAGAIQRTLVLDAQPIADYADLSQEQQEFLKSQCGRRILVDPAKMIRDITEEIIASPEAVDTSPGELAELIVAIAELYFAGEAPETLETQGRAGRIAAGMLRNDQRIGDIGQQIGAPSLDRVGRGNALATAEFMEQRPGFMGYLGQEKIKTTFDAPRARGMGGLYENGAVYIDKLVGTQTKDVFLRTVIHELGHATFQQLLLNKHKLSDDVSKGEHGDLNVKLGQIQGDQNLLLHNGGGGGRRNVRNQPNLQQQVGQMTQLVEQEEHIQTEIAKFTLDGMSFYNAWLVLRQNDGEYMLGVDLGKVMTSEKRKPYQAERFEEFCAESFMHILKEEQALRGHIQTLQNDHTVPGAVNQAWQQALVILVRYKQMIAG